MGHLPVSQKAMCISHLYKPFGAPAEAGGVAYAIMAAMLAALGLASPRRAVLAPGSRAEGRPRAKTVEVDRADVS